MVKIRNAPLLKGLSFRSFKDESDYSVMSVLSQKSWLADGFEWVQTADDLQMLYGDTADRNPRKDVVFIEVEREAVGYGEISIERIEGNTLILWNTVHLLPEWRGKGIRESVFEFNEKELVKRARNANPGSYFQVWANDAPNEWKSIVVAHGFKPSWHVLEMVRQNLDDIPRYDLPSGLEVRPVTPKDYRQVWEGMKEAYSVEPWFTNDKFDENNYKQWVDSPDFSPELWQTAWEGEKLAGIVQNFIKKEENDLFSQKRGHTERIFVAPSWQRKGLARALISRSLKVLRDEGMEEATLDVTAENVSGALNLYRSLGYKEIHHFTFYRKSLPR